MRKLRFTLFTLLFCLTSFSVKGSGGEGEHDIATTLFHHVKNSSELELFPYLPAIPLPFGVTVHDLMLLIASLVILGLFVPAFRRPSRKVSGIAVLLEAVVLFVRNDIVYPVMGKKRGDVWLPFFATLFLFIVTINYIGLIPAFKSATGNINVTGALAAMVFLLIFSAGFKNLGVLGFFKNMFPHGTPKPIGFFIVFIETFGFFIKSAVLSIRLFANMFAGHMVILSLIALIFIITPYFAVVSVPFAVFSFTLEMLIAVIQAFVFTLLSCVFINMAVTSH
jgi:F-type H+-transporting ATPase subunit a